MAFLFNLNQSVRIVAEDQVGTVVGRSEFIDPTANVYIVNVDGNERQWNESALEAHS